MSGPGQTQISTKFSEFSTLNAEVEAGMKTREHPVLDRKECRELPTRALSPQSCAPSHCNLGLTFLDAGTFALWTGSFQALRDVGGGGGTLAVPGPLQWPSFLACPCLFSPSTTAAHLEKTAFSKMQVRSQCSAKN